MAENIHPLAAHDLPSFITAPGETDTLMVAVAIFLVVTVVSVGVLYFNLHSLPERMSHKASRVQFEVVAVLGLLALFTHNHIFWIMALLLALIRIPDFETPLYSISDSLRKMSGGGSPPQSGPSLPPTTGQDPHAPAAGTATDATVSNQATGPAAPAGGN